MAEITMVKFNDEEIRNKLIEAISLGATYQIACDYAGIHVSNFIRWMNKALKEKIPEYCEFRQAIKKAQGKAAVGWLKVIENANIKEWTAAAWKMERRYYKDYSTNPAVRRELEEMEKRLNSLEKKSQGERNEKTKKMDFQSNQTPGSTP